MADEIEKPSVPSPAPEPDGYYGEDHIDMEELDLSFLDEDEAKKSVPEKI